MLRIIFSITEMQSECSIIRDNLLTTVNKISEDVIENISTASAGEAA